MNLTEYLHRTIPKPCYERPFVCDGLLESCTVVVIGENPATEMRTDWWSFWNDKNGFDLRKFESEYQELRLASGKRPISNTRIRLNRLRSNGLRCLETNVHKNERPGGRGIGSPNTDLLPVLLASLPSLRGVIAHGSVATRYLASLALPLGVQSYRMRHFRSESYSSIDEVAEQLR